MLEQNEFFPKSPMKEAILRVVRDNPGINSLRILSKVYRKEADDRSRNLISVHIAGMNKVLREHKLRIDGKGGGRYAAGYRLVEV